MSSMAVSWIVFGAVFAGALLGMILHACLPKHHLSEDSKDVVKLGMGLIATITALVLGLLTASAKNSFDAQRNGLAQLAANVDLLDRLLAHYGPEASKAREQLRNALPTYSIGLGPNIVHDLGAWRHRAVMKMSMERSRHSPRRTRRSVHSRPPHSRPALILRKREWLLFAQKGSSLPAPFLVVMVFWLAMLFASFSLFARPNATVVATLLVCALSVAGAVFLILELDRPFEGFIKISSDPLERALELLGR